ncbi:hypothetical protein LB505_014409 [Fusarium chuoi]|nr:hypothetical protein LB505_014409 [Fusarium chuoi]
MGTYMLIVAILTVKFPPNPDAGLTPPSIASLTMIYLEAMSYNISWGPVPWVYTAGPARLALPSALQRNGCSTSSFLKPLPTLSRTLAGGPFSCSQFSISRLLYLSGSLSRRPKASP